MPLSDRERAEGFPNNCYCGAVERERAEGFLPKCVIFVHTSQPRYEHEGERAEDF